MLHRFEDATFFVDGFLHCSILHVVRITHKLHLRVENRDNKNGTSYEKLGFIYLQLLPLKILHNST